MITTNNYTKFRLWTSVAILARAPWGMFDAFKEFVQQTEARVEAVARRAERSDALRADGPSEAEVLWFFYLKKRG